jgi:hypothetical protein
LGEVKELVVNNLLNEFSRTSESEREKRKKEIEEEEEEED